MPKCVTQIREGRGGGRWRAVGVSLVSTKKKRMHLSGEPTHSHTQTEMPASSVHPTSSASASQTTLRHLPCLLAPHELATVRAPSRWHRSVVVTERGVEEDPMRTSRQARLRDPQLIALLEQRLAAHGLVDAAFEEGSWCKYEVGQSYGLHGDAAGMLRGEGREWTLLVCIEAAARGGETDFPALRRRIALRPGDALLWPNFAGGVEDERMDHAALPPEEGRKVVINAWFSRRGAGRAVPRE